jgi:hypothetical protein
MSLITAITTIVGLDVLLLALLAAVLRMPFRLDDERAALVAAERATKPRRVKPRLAAARA